MGNHRNSRMNLFASQIRRTNLKARVKGSTPSAVYDVHVWRRA